MLGVPPARTPDRLLRLHRRYFNRTTETVFHTMNTDDMLTLQGEGYTLTIAEEAYERRNHLLDLACEVLTVTTTDDADTATMRIRNLANLRIQVEKARKEIKEPIIRVGKEIDTKAKEFLADVEHHEGRLKGLVATFAEQQARLAAEREAEERRVAEEARAAREAAERAAEQAAQTGTLRDIAAAQAAERDRLAALAARLDAADATAAAVVPDGVRVSWDFTVDDIDRLYRKHPSLVTIEPRRREILAMIKDYEERLGVQDMLDAFRLAGISVHQKTIVR